jgi:hypothetical protein
MPSSAPFDDELVDRLFDGSLAAGDAPASLAGVAGLFDLARQGAEATELDAEREVVTAMVTTLEGGSEPVEARVSRTRRVVALTALCTAGLATAAAALGAVSASREEPPGVSVGAVTQTSADLDPELTLPTSVPPTSAVATSPAPPTSADETTVPVTGPLATVPAIGPNAIGPAAFGLCTAWHEGKDRGARLDAPPFANLAAAAEVFGLTTEEYCAQVAEAHAAGAEGGPGATPPGRETSATAPGHQPAGPPAGGTPPEATTAGATSPGATAPGRSGGGRDGGNGSGGNGSGSSPGGTPTPPGRGGTPGATAPGRP